MSKPPNPTQSSGTPWRIRQWAVLLICQWLAGSAAAQWLESEPSNQQHPQQDPTFNLASLLVDGAQLHPTLINHPPDTIKNLPAGIDFSINPQLSSDPKVVNATARGGSQGRLAGTDMQAALYARYTDGVSDIGFYGLTAANASVADQREQALREIWAHNNRLDRTHVYRRGLVLLVVWIWSPGELPPAWQAVNDWVAQQMSVGH
ncbi:hypothetical protein [Marinicella meishanensis]|uniref:hypothetical protein n=1 Tax=Marinicella meishanensis TaxID=2873263 RepID=UPI001CBE573A|nr:hypothetical protein [Marinicella sp. NBU2979]